MCSGAPSGRTTYHVNVFFDEGLFYLRKGGHIIEHGINAGIFSKGS